MKCAAVLTFRSKELYLLQGGGGSVLSKPPLLCDRPGAELEDVINSSTAMPTKFVRHYLKKDSCLCFIPALEVTSVFASTEFGPSDLEIKL